MLFRSPRVEVNVPPDFPEVERKPHPLVHELVAWLIAGEPSKTIALPIPVADAEAVVREVLRLLPRALRLRLSFDTLWTGRGKYPPAVCVIKIFVVIETSPGQTKRSYVDANDRFG